MNLYTVEKKDSGLCLSKYIGRILSLAPKSFLYKALRNKDIRLNGKKALGTEILSEGDEVLFRFPDGQFRDLGGRPQESLSSRPEKGGDRASLTPYCTIIYEDEDILIADKKAGVLSQKSKPEDISLNEVLLSYAGGSSPAFTPSVCNRLDRNTTGLITFAKNYRGARELNDCFQKRDLAKIYLAAVFGDVRKPGTLSGTLVKDAKENQVTVETGKTSPGKEILTSYEPLSHAEICGFPVTLLRVRLMTGKTHQIRAHLKAAGLPVLGDPKYTLPEDDPLLPKGEIKEQILKKLRALGVRHQMLHSFELTLPGRGTFRAEIPDIFRKIFQEPF